MARYAISRTAPRRGVRTSAEVRPPIRPPASAPLSRASARGCASRLMADGPALEIPRLACGALEPFQPRQTYSGAFGLARNLLISGVGTPEDWEKAIGDPVNFMLRTVERAAAGFNRQAIDGVAHIDVLFGTSPYISSWHEKEYESPDRVFLAVEATHISVVYLRPTLELLGNVHPWLPATFYRILQEGLSSWVLYYDESAAEAFYEWRMESYEEARESGEEGLEKPQDIATAKGPWLSKKFKPLPENRIDEIIGPLKHRPKERRIIEGARKLQMLAKSRKRTRPYCDVWDEYYPNGSFSVPFTIVAFHEQDLVCQAFQSDEEDWMNGGEQQSPAFAVAFNPADPSAIAAGFEEFRHFLRVLEVLGELMALMPGCDVLEKQK